MLASIAGCGWGLSLGVSFMVLVLFMVYLGGIHKVDYVYSLSLVADAFQRLGRIGSYSVGRVLIIGGVY